MLPFSPDSPQKSPVKLPRLPRLDEQAMLAAVLYRDAHLLVVNKPAGIAVHIGANAEISIEQSFGYIQFGLPKPPVLAHRLDRDTAGCLVLGRHKQATARLGELFKQNKIEKTYIALVAGCPANEQGVIDRPILKSGQGSRWRITLDDAGQPASTEYRVLARSAEVSLLELKPKTGRTHQLRVHCAYALDCPIIGDPFYGMKEGVYGSDAASLMLQAARVMIPYDAKKPAIDISAPMPAHMQAMAAIAGITV